MVILITMKTIPAKVTPRLEMEMEEIIKEGWYASKSDFIRAAIRELIRKTRVERIEASIKEDVEWGLHGK